MAEIAIIDLVKRYAIKVSAFFPVKRVFLFGSYALGKERSYSDIDVAIILRDEPNDILETEVTLYKLRRDIDLRIEPILVDDKNDKSGFWDEISRYGKEVYSCYSYNKEESK